MRRKDMSKYNFRTKPNTNRSSGWRTIGGKRCHFRSIWEANFARYLELLKVHCHIVDWEFETETFWFEGIRRGVVSYLPDFKVINHGQTIYYEVKGYMDTRSRTKIKRMAKYFPSIKLVVIDSKWFAKMNKKLRPIIKDWEIGQNGFKQTEQNGKV
jgi:hypothetical protein